MSLKTEFLVITGICILPLIKLSIYFNIIKVNIKIIFYFIICTLHSPDEKTVEKSCSACYNKMDLFDFRKEQSKL